MTQINFQIRKLIFLVCSTSLCERILALMRICLVALGRETEGFKKKNKIIIISKSTGKDLAAFWKHYIFSILGIFLTFLKEFNYPELSHLISLNTHKRKNPQSKLKVGELCFILPTMRTFKRLENYFLLL